MENVKTAGRIRLPAKASFWYILSSAVARGVGVMGTPIFTRLLTAEEYGLYPLYTTWMGLFAVVVTLELTGGVVLRGLQKYEERRDEFMSGALGLCLTVFFIGSVIYFSLTDSINSFTGLSTGVTAAMLLNIMLNAVSAFFNARCRYEYKYKSVALVNLVSAFGIPLLSVLLIMLTPLRAEARIIAAVTVGAIVAIPLLYNIYRACPRLFNREIWLYLLKINLPMLPHYLSVAVILRIGEVTVGRIFGQATLGKYSVAMSLGMSLTMITGGLLSALSPWLLRKIRGGSFDKIRELVTVSTRGLCLLCLVILSVVPETMRLFTPAAYHDVLPAVYPLALTVIPMFLSGAISSAEMYYERSFLASLPSVAAAVICTTLSLGLLPNIDYRFTGVFVLVSYIAMTLLNLLVFRRMSGEWMIPIKKIGTTFALTVLYAMLILVLRENFLSRLVLLIPILPMLVVCARSIWRQIKETDETGHAVN